MAEEGLKKALLIAKIAQYLCQREGNEVMRAVDLEEAEILIAEQYQLATDLGKVKSRILEILDVGITDDTREELLSLFDSSALNTSAKSEGFSRLMELGMRTIGSDILGKLN